MKLAELQTGQKAVILRVHGSGAFRKRILEMGFIQGKEITVVHNAPLKDPIYYKILDYNVSLRYQDAKKIEVRLLEELEQAPSEVDLSEHRAVPSPELHHLHRQGNIFTRGAHLPTIRIALLGNPNCGKTSLFNQASGAHEHVGNYSGVTIEAKTGYIYYAGYRIELIDLPGSYSLSPYSPEERYIRDYLTGDQRPDLVLNVLDTCNLERNLYLTIQLKELGLPVVAALNMFDEFMQRQEYLDYPRLSRLLGIPMIPTICRTGLGLEALFDEIISLAKGLKETPDTLFHPEHGELRPLRIPYGPLVEPLVQELTQKIQEHTQLTDPMTARFFAVKLLEKDQDIEKQLISRFSRGGFLISARDFALRKLLEQTEEEAEALITDARYGFIAGALKETYIPAQRGKRTLTDKIDDLVTHRVWGFPIFLLLMVLMFFFTFTLGQYPMDLIDAGVNWLGELVGRGMSEGPLRDLIVDGVIAGVGGVIVFLPQIVILYLFISLLEDSGYMARAAFIMDKLMHRMGLHGKSFIPLVMGFGCNVPAVMSTRMIESHKSRMITMLVLPFMSCSARLPVYLLLAGALFPIPWQSTLILFALYAIGVFVAVLSARLLKSKVFTGEDIPFVMELPPYRLPTIRSVGIHVWTRARQYLQKMGTVILAASILVWFMSYYPRQNEARAIKDAQIAQVESLANLPAEVRKAQVDSLEHAFATFHQEQSIIGHIGHWSEPIIRPLGFDWKMGVSIVSGLMAKEVVVSTMGVIYTGTNSDDEEAVANLSARMLQERRPDGSPSFTPLIGFCFMLFVLLYFPCIATLIAIGRESGHWRWGVFAALYSCGVAWLVCFLVYQGSLLLH